MKPALAGGLLGAALFLAVFGTAMVRPTNLGWTMRHDLQTYVLAWTHFRHEPWQWPPGAISGVGHPVGTSIGNTDAIPLLAFALKPVQAWLPEPTQYLGAWLLACFVLQGVFGALLVGLATTDWRLQLLGAALFVQVPALFSRMGHPALSAHWLLLAAIWLLIDGGRAWRRWHLAAWLGVAATVAAVQPYLAAMVLLLAVAAVANHAWPLRPVRRAALTFVREAAAIVAVVGLVFWQCGFFLIGAGGNLQSEGLGLLSMNLLGPVMGMGFTTLLPEIAPATAGQFEGHVYFGAGWLLLSGLMLVVFLRGGRPAVRLGLGWVAVAACVAIALSPRVTFGAATLVDLTASAPAALAVFRSSGRFGWVPMYVAFAVVTVELVSRLPRRAAIAAMAVAVVVQGLDMSGAYRALHARGRSPEWTDYDSPMKSAAWQAIVPRYRHLVMVPPDMCAAVWAPVAGPHLPFSLVAGTNGVTINSGNAGRYDTGAVLRYCASLEAEVRAGHVSDDSLYVLSPAMREVFVAAARVPLACGTLDGFAVCTSAATARRWGAAVSDGGAVFPE